MIYVQAALAIVGVISVFLMVVGGIGCAVEAIGRARRRTQEWRATQRILAEIVRAQNQCLLDIAAAAKAYADEAPDPESDESRW